MSEYQIYHNSRCRKSREALQLLKDEGINPEIVEYLKDTPDREEFKLVLAKLHMKPEEVLRKEESLFKEKYKTFNFTDDEWIDVMLENPKLIQRPIVIKANRAVIGRPIENVKELLK
jgi:arsenate reductase